MKRERGRLGTSLMISVFVLFTGLGVVILIVGRGPDRIFGLLCVLLFGSGGAAYAIYEHRQPDVALSIDTITWNGAVVRAVVVPVRTIKAVAGLVGALGVATMLLLVGVSASTMAEPGEDPVVVQVIGYGGGTLLLLAVIAAVLRLRHGLPRLVLLPQGVALTGGIAASFVPWSAIAEIGTFEIAVRGTSQKFAALRATDPAMINRTRLSKAMAGKRIFAGWDLMYSEAMFDITAEQLVTLLEWFVQRPELRRVAESLPDGPLSYQEFVRRHVGEEGASAGPAADDGRFPR